MSAIVLFCIGAVVMVLSAAWLWRMVGLFLIGRRTTGSLVAWRHAFERKWLRSGHEIRTTFYYPVVRFEAANGSQHKVEGSVGYPVKPDWPADRRFVVRYNPTDPADATVDPATRMWVFPAVFLAAGVAVLLAAFGLR